MASLSWSAYCFAFPFCATIISTIFSYENKTTFITKPHDLVRLNEQPSKGSKQ